MVFEILFIINKPFEPELDFIIYIKYSMKRQDFRLVFLALCNSAEKHALLRDQLNDSFQILWTQTEINWLFFL